MRPEIARKHTELFHHRPEFIVGQAYKKSTENTYQGNDQVNAVGLFKTKVLIPSGRSYGGILTYHQKTCEVKSLSAG